MCGPATFDKFIDFNRGYLASIEHGGLPGSTCGASKGHNGNNMIRLAFDRKGVLLAGRAAHAWNEKMSVPAVRAKTKLRDCIEFLSNFG
jgi:hypothetical protein